MDENPYEAPQTKPLADGVRPNQLVMILRRYGSWFGLAFLVASSLVCFGFFLMPAFYSHPGAACTWGS